MAKADREELYRHTAERLPVGYAGEAAEIAETYLYRSIRLAFVEVGFGA